ncbi:hypothetical protein [Bacillus infantis]|nr:hypothetical protein [Bacillus infantis]
MGMLLRRHREKQQPEVVEEVKVSKEEKKRATNKPKRDKEDK